MLLDLIVIVAALIVSWLVFNWLIKVLNATVKTAFAIAIFVLVLQLAFGIAPVELWQQITQLPETIWQLVTGTGE